MLPKFRMSSYNSIGFHASYRGHVVDFSLRFTDNKTGHGDIELRFAGQTWTCDSYYFVLDSGVMPDVESAGKVRAVLDKLLEQWLASVESMPDRGMAFLPYDFSDHYTAWLRCQRSGRDVWVERGWSHVEGWSFFPSAVGELLRRLPDFQPDGPKIRVELTDFLEAIRTARAAAV
jgi:hypothetical protein